MDTSECFALIESNFKHLFKTDRENNAITLRPGFGNIPPFTMVCVEGGEFLMGENGIDDFKNPPHRVSLSSFFMAEFPVTQEIYLSITGKNPSQFEGVNHPVERVRWYDATEFCNQLNERLKLPIPYRGEDVETKCNFQCVAFRLPTEAEWEYAARGGKTAKRQTEYPGSNNLNKVAWYNKNNSYETKPVGLKFPNQLGLYDMSGNVPEWCWDWHDSDYYDQCAKNGLTTNPVGPENGGNRVVRGGAWYCEGGGSVACRDDKWPDDDWGGGGFRLLFALQFTFGPGKAG